MSAVLQARHLAKSFPAARGVLSVIGDISFDIGTGEIVAILGASGCGKTTLLRLLLGLDKPDSGHIETALVRPGPEIGYHAQNDSLLPWRTIRDNIALGPELAGQSKATARQTAARLLQKVGLGAFQDNPPRTLSGGMMQRALLARTLALEPKLLLLDEPMSNLDIIARRELGAAIKSYVKERQAAAIIVTHSVEEACQIADRVLIISQKPARILQQLPATGRAEDIAAVHQALADSIRGAA